MGTHPIFESDFDCLTELNYIRQDGYDIFGKFGALRQVRLGIQPDTKGTAHVVYEDIHDAKNACDHLSGFNVCNRYLVVLYYNPTRAFKKLETEKKEKELIEIRKRMGLNK